MGDVPARRSLEQLTGVDDPAWPLVEGWVESAVRPVEVLPPPAPALRDEVLVEAQASLRSAMGAVVYHTGGLLIDNGWIRVLGSGHPRLPRTLPGWNREVHAADVAKPPFTLIADDAA